MRVACLVAALLLVLAAAEVKQLSLRDFFTGRWTIERFEQEGGHAPIDRANVTLVLAFDNTTGDLVGEMYENLTDVISNHFGVRVSGDELEGTFSVAEHEGEDFTVYDPLFSFAFRSVGAGWSISMGEWLERGNPGTYQMTVVSPVHFVLTVAPSKGPMLTWAAFKTRSARLRRRSCSATRHC